eukprot:3589523-Amphidinium_carterae.2
MLKANKYLLEALVEAQVAFTTDCEPSVLLECLISLYPGSSRDTEGMPLRSHGLHLLHPCFPLKEGCLLSVEYPVLHEMPVGICPDFTSVVLFPVPFACFLFGDGRGVDPLFRMLVFGHKQALQFLDRA